MDQFKLQMNWNQEELEQWALAARQKEEDNLALLKYSKADETRMKDLNLQLERVLSAVLAKQRELDDEVTETQARQIELDKTAEDFRALHRERRSLLRQWEDSVSAMQKRDEAIARAHEVFVAGEDVLGLGEGVEVKVGFDEEEEVEDEDGDGFEQVHGVHWRRVGVVTLW